MVAINAFVAHSFTTDDDILVGKFLEYFDQLSKSQINFSFVRAKAAEPKVLAEKVKSLLANRNVLIAICTKKERVISPNVLAETWLPPGFLKAPQNEFFWKTSDWIIQEIGLAIGRGLELILLLEEGVQKPGPLQGDLEYIPFNRDFPERSFGRIVDMLNALSPKGRSVETATDPRSPVTDEATAAATPSAEDNWWKTTPQPDWDRRRYEIALLLAIEQDESDTIESIYQAYLTTPDARLPDNKQRWEAYQEYLRLLLGKGGRYGQRHDIMPSDEVTGWWFCGRFSKMARSGQRTHRSTQGARLSSKTICITRTLRMGIGGIRCKRRGRIRCNIGRMANGAESTIGGRWRRPAKKRLRRKCVVLFWLRQVRLRNFAHVCSDSAISNSTARQRFMRQASSQHPRLLQPRFIDCGGSCIHSSTQ